MTEVNQLDQAGRSNRAAQSTWNARPVGCQRSKHSPGDIAYFADLRKYRYGYETPFIPLFFDFASMAGKKVLEIGVGNGIDAVSMAECGALYSGIDVAARHIELATANLRQHGIQPRHMWHGDLLDSSLAERFDIVYAFGVLHHIAHERSYLEKLHDLLTLDGRLLIGVYSKYSFFNVYLLVSWILRTAMRVPYDAWRSHIAEASELNDPVTIRIRSRSQVQQLLEDCGFRVLRYQKRGFVQGNIPLLGRYFAPGGAVLNGLGALLGWYHLFECATDEAGPDARR